MEGITDEEKFTIVFPLISLHVLQLVLVTD